MATLIAAAPRPRSSDDRFFLIASLLMALVLVGGFVFHLAMGRSSFARPWPYHVHAIIFMGWIGLFLAQVTLATGGRIALHRTLGWIAAGWAGLLVVAGIAITVIVVRAGTSPFVFQPQQFLVFNPLTVVGFAGLTAAAIIMRRRTDWHRRLHMTGMAMLLGPGFGRLLPLPLLIPWGFEAAYLAGVLFPVAGAIADKRRRGSVHPAWVWGIGTMLAVLAAIELVAVSPAGDWLYAVVTAGSPGAAVPGRAFPPFPPGA